MSRIKNIIFDLGGVLLQIDYKKTEDAFSDLGIGNFSEYFTQEYVSTLFNDFETGKINAKAFYTQFRELTKSTLTDEQIKNAWNAMLQEFWSERLEWLNTINCQFEIFLLSNINEIHYEQVLDIYNKSKPTKPFSDYFKKDYYSHILGKRKPNIDTYLKVLEEQCLIANETLFIDDTLKNIVGAAQVGMQVLHLLPNMDLKREVELTTQ